jgi:hypothetical protein
MKDSDSDLGIVVATALIGAGVVWVSLMGVNLHQQGLMPWQNAITVKSK